MKKFFIDFIEHFQKTYTMTWAASLAFYTALSLAPFLLVILFSLSFLSSGSEHFLKEKIVTTFGTDVLPAVDLVIKNAKMNTDMKSFTGILGIITLFLSASLIFAQVRSALDVIFKTEADDETLTFWQNVFNFLKLRLFNVAIVLSFILLMMFLMLFAAFLRAISHWSVLNLSGIYLVSILNIAVSLSVYLVSFFLLFKYVPSKKIPSLQALYSACFTTVFFLIGKELIALYLGQTAVGSPYGAAGSLVVLLAWVYYSSIILFVSAHLGHLLIKRKKLSFKKSSH